MLSYQINTTGPFAGFTSSVTRFTDNTLSLKWGKLTWMITNNVFYIECNLLMSGIDQNPSMSGHPRQYGNLYFTFLWREAYPYLPPDFMLVSDSSRDHY